MFRRSEGLRKILSDSIRPSQAQEAHDQVIRGKYYSAERKRKVRENYEGELEAIEALEAQHEALLEACEEMTDEEFDRAYTDASQAIDTILKRITRYDDEIESERQYTIDFVEMSRLDSLEAFVKEFAMQFIPRKQEIGRILSIAKQMHESRVAQGEVNADEPIRVVDVGGSSGLLGKFMVDLAQENGIEIDYTVIDPDTKTIDEASEFYREDPSMSFRDMTGSAFARELYADDHELIELMDERDRLVAEGQQKEADLQRVVDEIERLEEEELSVEKMREYLDILRSDFGINLPETLLDSPEDFQEAFEDDYDEYPAVSFVRKYMNEQWKARVASVADEVERRIGEKPTSFDLVINSWMPVRVDFTRDVRAMNGAAIFYAMERYGATGCRSDAPYPEQPTKLMEIESCNPGEAYQSRVGWVSHATPQVGTMRRDGHGKTLWRDMDRQTPTFANGFIVQTKYTFAHDLGSIEPEAAGIEVQGEYPWERELTEDGGDLCAPVALIDRGSGFNRKLDVYSSMSRVADDLQDDERKKRGVEY